MPIPSAARFSIFKMSTLPVLEFRRRTSIFFCIFVVKFGHGSLCCSRALNRVIKVSCRFIIFIYKETLPIFARSVTALWYSELWTFILARRLVSAENRPQELSNCVSTPSSIGRASFMHYAHKGCSQVRLTANIVHEWINVSEISRISIFQSWQLCKT